MNAKSRSFVDYRLIKKNISIHQVLEHYDLLDQFQESDDSLAGCCPIHRGTNPSHFRVSLSKNAFNCFGDCGRGGNVIDFVSLMEQVRFHQAAVLLVEWFSLDEAIPKPEPKRPTARRRSRGMLQSAGELEEEINDEPTGNKPLGFELKKLERTHPYFDKRGLSEAIIEEFGLGFCHKGLHAGRIAIPIHNPVGAIVGYAGHWPGDPPDEKEQCKWPKGFRKDLELYGLHRVIAAGRESPLIIVEGLFDCMHLWANGHTDCLALMDSSMSEQQEKLLFDTVPAGRPIILMLDDDDAGHHGCAEILPRLAIRHFVRVASLPKSKLHPEELSADELNTMLAI